MKLNFGSGKKPYPGYVNIDCEDYLDPDVVLDMTKFPYPYKTSTVDEILCEHTLEHFELPMFIKILNEFYRMLKPNGILKIAVPYYNHPNAFCDSHKLWFLKGHFIQYCNEKAMKEWNKRHNNWVKFKFELIKQEGHPTILGRLIPPFLRWHISIVLGYIIDEIRVKMKCIK